MCPGFRDSKCCLLLRYKDTCLACRVFARLVKLLDLAGSVTLEPHLRLEAPSARRTWAGVVRELDESELYGATVAELARVGRLPLQPAINQVLRTALKWAVMAFAWTKGELVTRPREVAV